MGSCDSASGQQEAPRSGAASPLVVQNAVREWMSRACGGEIACSAAVLQHEHVSGEGLSELLVGRPCGGPGSGRQRVLVPGDYSPAVLRAHRLCPWGGQICLSGLTLPHFPRPPVLSSGGQALFAWPWVAGSCLVSHSSCLPSH